MQLNSSVSQILSMLFTALLALILTACGGGGGGGSAEKTQGVGGGGVKGPLANAIVTAYAFDGSAAGFKGAVIDTGTTGADAKITGLDLALPLAPPYILEFTSDSGTTDITTSMAPVITTMRTVLTQALLDTNEDIYATPLTTMATDIAIANADSNTSPFSGNADGTTTSAEFVAALPAAASQVTSTLGFGIDSNIDIFDTPPLIDDTTDTTAEQTNVAAYRSAVEALTAIVYEMDQQSSGTTPDDVLAEITSDLANDGLIDGTTESGTSTVLVATTLAVLDQDPATLPIPNDPLNQTVADVEAILDAETATTGTTTTTTGLADGSINTVVKPALTNPDIDADGVLNADDAYPNDATADTDTDGDGAPDVAYTDAGRGTVDTARSDADDDNDGWLDTEDDFPSDASQFLSSTLDRDGDGVANGTDLCPLDAADACAGITDTDSDGIADANDNCPVNANPSQSDIDTDATGDVCDTDIDGDLVLNGADAFPLDSSESIDTDGDGIGNVTDTDDDNDGISDIAEQLAGTNSLLADSDGDGVFDGADAFPTDMSESVDTDNDGTGNNADTDDDNDGLTDTQEATAGTKPLVADTDGDGLLDGAENEAGTNPLLTDTDADGRNDNADNCPVLANSDQLNTDGDDQGNVCDADDDNDGLTDAEEVLLGTNPLLADTDSDGSTDALDNCPILANTDQLNTDGDTQGNVCDADDDNDGLTDTAEVAAGTNPLLADSDGDGVNDNVDIFPLNEAESADMDNDTVGNNIDNCPAVANTDQLDTDNDLAGNVCDTDDDNDGLTDVEEAALGTDPLLVDTDGDGSNDNVDAFPLDPAEQLDSDNDSVGDIADVCPNDPATSTDPTVCAGVNITGVYKLTMTITGVAPLNTGVCSGGDAVGDVEIMYGSFSQTAADITMTAVSGDVLTGTMSDSTTGDYSITSGIVTTTSPYTTATTGQNVTVVGTETTGTALAGLTSYVNGSAMCLTNYDVVTTKVYTHVAGENYNGVYGMELLDSDDTRSSLAVQFEITGSTMAIYLPPEQNFTESITNTFFDPNTGFFSFDINGLDDYSDGSGSEEWSDKLTGVLLRAPDDASGQPIVAINIDQFSGIYNATGGSTGGGTVQAAYSGDEQGYAKRLSSTAFTRSSYYRNGATGNKVEGILMGVSHPSMKPATATSDLYVEVLDGSSRLCTGLYAKRYVNAHYEPAADMTAEAFQSQFYSFATCDTSGGTGTPTVINGNNYTVRIMDTGADGVIDGGDDTEIAGNSMTVTAQVSPAFFTNTVNVHDYRLNGVAPSQTMKRGFTDGVIQLFGYIDVGQPLDFSWTGFADAQQYTLETKLLGERDVTRFNLTASAGAGTETITLPANTLNTYESQLIRIRARKDDAATGARALSISNKWLMINPGIQGLFNVELGGAAGANHDTFQVWLEANIGESGTGDITSCEITNNPNWACGNQFGQFGVVNYTTNTLSLYLKDSSTTLTTADMVMTIIFSDSANATVNGLDVITTGTQIVPVLPVETHVRLVNPELIIRSLQPSGSVSQQSLVILTNILGGGSLASGQSFDKGVFKRDDNGALVTGVNSNENVTAKLSWDDTAANTKPFDSVVGTYQLRPTNDGQSQRAGHFLADVTGGNWGLGFGLLDGNFGDGVRYKSVWLNSADSTMKLVFKADYYEPNASVLVTPVHEQVTVDLPTPVTAGVLTGSAIGEAANPIDVSTDPTFDLTWIGSAPAGTLWQVRVIYTAGASMGGEVRSPWMDPATHPDLTYNAANSTWSWVNNSGITLVSGDTVNVQIRARDAAFTILGVQRARGVDDRVHLTMP